MVIIPASLALHLPSLACDEKFAPFPLTTEDVWEAQRSDQKVQKLYETLLRDDSSSGEADSGFNILEDKVSWKTKHADRGDLYRVSLGSVVLQAYHKNPLSGHFGRFK